MRPSLSTGPALTSSGRTIPALSMSLVKAPRRSRTIKDRAPEDPQATAERERLSLAAGKAAQGATLSNRSELRSFGLYALRRKMYSPHLKPLNTLNQTQKRGILRQGRALNNLRRLRQSTASTGLLKRVTLSGRALLCDFFRDGRLPVGGSRGHREGLSVSTQHRRCAEGLRLPP